MSANRYAEGVDWVMRDLEGIQPSPDPAVLKPYLEELFSWNPRLGLVSKKDTEKTVSKLIQLSISLWNFTYQNQHPSLEPAMAPFMDIGTGGGFPGLIWKMINPDLECCLVERKVTKAQFLNRVIRTFSWSGVEVVAADAADLYRNTRYQESFSLVTMIAVKPPPVLAQAIEAFLKPEGYFCTVRSSSQKIIEDRLGENLFLQKALTYEEGILVLYRKAQ